MGIRNGRRLLALLVCGAACVANAQDFTVIEARGEASYRVPILVPPGPANHQPELALVYGSGDGRGPSGWLGFGWSLSGESRIERESRSAAPYDFDDRSCGAGGKFPCYRSAYALDGQDLICSSETCGVCTSTAPCRYRTQSDDGRLIEFRGESSGWAIADRDGRISVYGAAPSGASRLANPLSLIGEIYSWQIERTTDVNGNEIRYTYDTISSANIAYLRKIEYGQGTSANRSIEFVLNEPVSAPRLDEPVWVRAGFRQQMNRRVAAIEVRAASNELVTKYVLGYSHDPDSLRSRLETVQRFGSDSATSLPPYRFWYSERAPGDGFEQTNEPGFFGSPTQCPPLGGIYADPSGHGLWNIADLNRDGLADLYFVHAYNPTTTAGRTEVALGTGTRFVPGAGLWCGAQLARGSLWSDDRLFFGSTLSVPTLQIGRAATLDLDGDGFLDHIDRQASYRAGSFDSVPAGLRLGSAAGFSAATLPTSMELPHFWSFDFGDGWNADDFWIRLATTESGAFGTRALLSDVTGDGRPDLIATRGTTGFEYFDGVSLSATWASWNGWAVFANRGLRQGVDGSPYLDFGSEPILWPAATGSGIETISNGITSAALVDQNGDGLPDRLTLGSVAYGYGAGFLSSESVSSNLSYDLVVAPQYVQAGLYDLNGDGFLDHVAKQDAASDPFWHVHFGTGHGFNPSDSLFRRVVDWIDEGALEADGLYVGSRSIRDVNGDGRLDYVAAGRRSVFLQEGVANHDGEKTEPLAGLLTKAVDPLGGKVEFSYATSPQFQNDSGAPANPEMPLLRPVVIRFEVGDGRASTPTIVSKLEYADGVFDFAEKEFRGFGTVVETQIEDGIDGTRTTSSYRTDRVCAFNLASREVGRGAVVLERESQSYVEVVGGGTTVAEQWTRCLPATHVAEAVEGDEAAKRARRTSWDYGTPIDPHYNVAKLEEWGEWDLAANQDVPGDERVTEFMHLPASAEWPSIVSRLGLLIVRDGAGNIYSKRQYCYADSDCKGAGRGLPVLVRAHLTDYFANPPVIDVAKTVATIDYDAFGNPTQSIGAATPDDPDGLRTTIAYDATYQTFPTEIRNGADVAPPLRPLSTSLAYGGCAGGLSPPSALGLPCSVTSPQGSADRLGYDALGRVKRVERQASGYVETRSYTIPGASAPGANVFETRIVRPGEADLVERQHLDGLARVHRQESPGTESETLSVERTFDDRGRLRSESLPQIGGSALARVFSYDGLDRMTVVLDPDALTRQVLGYAPWTVIDETYFGPATPANRRERTERSSDGLGRMVRVAGYEDATNPTTPYLVTAKYDAADRLYEVRDPIANAPSLCVLHAMGPHCATQDHVTEIAWDTLGRRVRIDDPDSGLWTWVYDDAGRLIERAQNPGTSDARVQHLRYDPLGRLSAKSFTPAGMGAADASFVYGQDDASPDFAQLIAVVSADPSGTSYAYEYDAAGRRMVVRQRTAGTEFTSGFAYDELGRVKRRVFPDGEAFDYGYDGLRLREIRADPGNSAFTGAVLRHADYDALGRMTSIEIGQGAGGAALVTQAYGYDPATARLTRATAKAGALLTDDPDGDRVGAASDICPNAYDPDQLDSGGIGGTSGPDGIGNGCQCGDVDGSGRVTYADGFEILLLDFGDAALSRPDLCDVDGNGSCNPWDFLAVLNAVSSGSGSLQNCAATKPVNLPSSESLDLEVEFDGLGRLVAQSGALGAEPVSRSYTYDGLSRIASATGPWEKARGAADPVTWSYRYDALGNLREQESSRPESRAGDHRTWSYDHATKPNALSQYVEPGKQWEAIYATAGGEVSRIDLGSGYGRETFTWNAQGKLHHYKGSTYGYDAFGALTHTVTGPTGAPATIVSVGDDFEYDLAAQRANKHFSIGGVRIASLATRYAAANPVLAATLVSGAGEYGRHDEPIVAYFTDHLGSIRAVVNQDGVAVETRDYAIFGDSIAHVGAYSVAHRFTGQPQDDRAGGLYNYGARFYNPSWGRFISPDDVVQGLDSQSLNPFAYVLNRPTSATDPTGRLIWNGVSFGAWSTATLQSGALQRAPTFGAGAVASARLVAGPNPGFAGFLTTSGTRPTPSLLGMLAKVLLTDFQALALGSFSQFAINPFLSVGNLIDRSLNGDLRGMGRAVEQLIKGTLTPRYGLQNGPYWGRDKTSNGRLDSILEEAGFVHDGACAGGCSNDADRAWIRIAWSDPWKLGPYGQAYRLLGTAAFSGRIAWRTLTGQP